MIYHCTQCKSERIHKSRFRPGERTASNLFLAPYRCRDCGARFWGRNNDAYLAATIGTGSILLLSTLIWIGFFSDDIDWEKIPTQMEAGLAELSGDNLPPVSLASSGNSLLSEAIKRGEKIDLHTIKDKKPHSLPNPDDKRLYTVNLFLEKAQKGDADAQYQLGMLHLTGRGTLQDFSEASKWLILAAGQNHPLAQYELGLLYQIGQGVDMDNEKSYMWLNLAAAVGVDRAILARDKVMRSLSKAQLSSAQKSAREWLASKSKSKK